MYCFLVQFFYSKRSLLTCLITGLLLSFHSVSGQNIPDISKIVDLTNKLNSSRLKVKKDTSWHKIDLGATFTQSAFSGNWSSGGVSSLGLGTYLNALFENKKGKNAWRTDVQLQYGLLKNKEQGNRKSLDRIFFDTKYARDLNKNWTMFANVNFQSQFSAGFNYDLMIDSVVVKKKISQFLAPAYLTQSLGFEYKPVDYFFVNFAPGAFRQTIVWNKDIYPYTPEGKNYGVPISKRVKNDVALLQIVANCNKDLTKTLNLKLRYQLYSSWDDPLNTDNRLDASITAKINKAVNANFSAIVIYDADQADRIQIAQGMNVGFLYSF